MRCFWLGLIGCNWNLYCTVDDSLRTHLKIMSFELRSFNHFYIEKLRKQDLGRKKIGMAGVILRAWTPTDCVQLNAQCHLLICQLMLLPHFSFTQKNNLIHFHKITLTVSCHIWLLYWYWQWFVTQYNVENFLLPVDDSKWRLQRLNTNIIKYSYNINIQ